VRSGRFAVRRPPALGSAVAVPRRGRRRDCWAVRRWRLSLLRV